MKLKVYDYQCDRLIFELNKDATEMQLIGEALTKLNMTIDDLHYDSEHNAFFTTNYEYSFSTAVRGTHKVVEE